MARGIVKFIRRFGGILVVGMWLLACGKSQATQEYKIETAEELISALEAAGASVFETAGIGQPAFGVPARFLQVNQTVIQVYEYEEIAAREAVSRDLATYGSDIAGTPFEWSGRPNIWVEGNIIVVYEGLEGGMFLLLSGFMDDPITQPASPIDEPYPPAVPMAMEFLAQSLGVDPEVVEVIDFEPVDWPNSCLGYDKPVESCADMETPGWRIGLRVEGVDYETHSDLVGEQVRLK